MSLISKETLIGSEDPGGNEIAEVETKVNPIKGVDEFGGFFAVVFFTQQFEKLVTNRRVR